MLCTRMMATRFPFLPFLVSSFVGLFFLVRSTSLLLVRLCSGQAKSDESATSTIQHYIDQQVYCVGQSNQICFSRKLRTEQM